MLYTYADGDVAHGAYTKKGRGGRLRGGRARHAAACAGPMQLVGSRASARSLLRLCALVLRRSCLPLVHALRGCDDERLTPVSPWP